MRQEIREILASVAKPFRYLGGEVGSIHRDWDSADVRMCLAFPDVYEIGMSHLGLSILYHLINSQDGMLAERAFAPWVDMEAELNSRDMPLFALESHRPVRDFDLLGMSLAYELTYTNVLAMLSLAGIPVRACDRADGDPIVIAGGPCAFNPEPIAPFFDAIVIGDGEETTLEIAELLREGKTNGLSRADIVSSFSKIQGVYLPGVQGEAPGMARVFDLDQASFPNRPMCAYSATQERVAVEVARGCARGCRFCQAGYVYRPVRQRECQTAVSLAAGGIESTGREDFSFLSLSVSDWSPLESALKGVHTACGSMEVNASLPSLRVEALEDGLMNELGRARSGSFTLAPEAATERMRRVINKGNTDADLYASVERVFSGGWQAIKLYFMLGLPGETDEDVEGIVKVANRCLDIGRKYHKRPNVTVSTSTFVPKPHTPFQWEAQISVERTVELQRLLKRRLRRPGLYYRWHTAEMSFLEGALARGGREIADVIEKVVKAGARFDSWDEGFDYSKWMEAFEACGIEPAEYMNARNPGDEMPWDRLGAGPSHDFLVGEREKASSMMATPDCTTGACSNCGICDFKELKNRLAKKRVACDVGRETAAVARCTSHATRTNFRYRFKFTKVGRAAFLGQVETLDILRQTLRAAKLPLVYTAGYHPRAKVAAGPALPLGVESAAEYLDVELSCSIDPLDMRGDMNDRLPEGLEVVGAVEVDSKVSSIDEGVSIYRYEVDVGALGMSVSKAIDRCQDADTLPFTRVRREKRADVDVKEYIVTLAESDRGVLGIGVFNRRPALKVSEILSAVLDISEQEARKLSVRKVGVEWKENASQGAQASQARKV